MSKVSWKVNLIHAFNGITYVSFIPSVTDVTSSYCSVPRDIDGALIAPIFAEDDDPYFQLQTREFLVDLTRLLQIGMSRRRFAFFDFEDDTIDFDDIRIKLNESAQLTEEERSDIILKNGAKKNNENAGGAVVRDINATSWVRRPKLKRLVDFIDDHFRQNGRNSVVGREAFSFAILFLTRDSADQVDELLAASSPSSSNSSSPTIASSFVIYPIAIHAGIALSKLVFLAGGDPTRVFVIRDVDYLESILVAVVNKITQESLRIFVKCSWKTTEDESEVNVENRIPALTGAEMIVAFPSTSNESRCDDRVATMRLHHCPTITSIATSGLPLEKKKMMRENLRRCKKFGTRS